MQVRAGILECPSKMPPNSGHRSVFVHLGDPALETSHPAGEFDSSKTQVRDLGKLHCGLVPADHSNGLTAKDAFLRLLRCQSYLFVENELGLRWSVLQYRILIDRIA